MTSPFERIQVIANPASGQAEPVLATINKVFSTHEVDWQIAVTHSKGDGATLAQAAIADGVDLIAAYGGDGTIGDVASGMVGSEIPLAILPGGTGNALAKGLHIPVNLHDALEQIFSGTVKQIDMGKANDQVFILRADMGISTITTRDASQELKERLGILAYLISTVQGLGDIQPIDFKFEIDGEAITSSGIACILTNHYELGGFGLKFSDSVRPDDGLLDVFVIKDVNAVLALLTAPLTNRDPGDILDHWQGKAIRIDSDPAQAVHLDGDPFTETPVEIKVLPGAIRVVVPEEDPAQTT
jgi:YegS/Rv2252/BmrU family lipid kinase